MKNYFYLLCAAGIACGVLKRMVPSTYKKTAGTVFAVIMLLTAISPFKTAAARQRIEQAVDADAAMEAIYAGELRSQLQNKLDESEYKASVGNIYCECKDGEIDVSYITFKGDERAKPLISQLTGVPEDRVREDESR